MTRPLRVLQVLTNLDRGGMETMTMNFYRHMDRGRIQFDFLLHRESEGDYEAEARSLGSCVYRVPRQNPLSFGYWHALDRFFAEHPYRIVHVQLDCMSAEPLAAAAKHGVAVRIAHSHNSCQDRDLKYPLKMICKRFIAQQATDLFACGEQAGRWMFGGAPFRVIRNAIDVDAYSYDPIIRAKKRIELGISPNTPVVGHVGRFDPAKNQLFLVEAFSLLLAERPDAVLLLVGDGRMRPEVEQCVSRLGIGSSVLFLGLRNDVNDLMQAMDVLCLPSLYEGLPLVLVEAQAAGLPCLVSDAVPRDGDIDDGVVKRASIAHGAEGEWAQRLGVLLTDSGDRASGAYAVREAGFDVVAEAAWLQEFYLVKSEREE